MDPEVVLNPAAAFARLRTAGTLAYCFRWGGFWSAFRYRDVLRIAADHRTFVTSIQNLVPASPRSGLPRPPLQLEPPAHARFRRVLNPHFEPTRIQHLEPDLRDLADQFLRPWLDRGSQDAVTAYAAPLAIRSVARLLGLSEEPLNHIQQISSQYVEAVGQNDRQRAAQLSAALDDFARQIARNALHSPVHRDDPLTHLWHARAALGIGLDHVAGFVRALLVGADRSTTNALASAIWHLAQDPRLQDHLRANPHSVPAAVDEFLRLYPPTQATARTAVRDTLIAHQIIRAGEVVAMVFFSANRDPSVFPDPDRFRLDRPRVPHLSFGHGRHKCLGQYLARLVVRVALQQLLSRTTHFRLAGPVAWRHWPEYGPRYLPVVAT